MGGNMGSWSPDPVFTPSLMNPAKFADFALNNTNREPELIARAGPVGRAGEPWRFYADALLKEPRRNSHHRFGGAGRPGPPGHYLRHPPGYGTPRRPELPGHRPTQDAGDVRHPGCSRPYVLP